MSNKAYNLSFRMYLEGVLAPFNGATVMCTPNGVEANINIPSNKYISDLKPKTAVQIFYKDWISTSNPEWRLMFDGSISGFYKTDESEGGRGISLICRDFRMDMRKAPAAIAYLGEQDLTNQNLFYSEGLFNTRVVKGVTPESKGKQIRTYDSTGLNDLSSTIKYIAGTAYGTGLKSDYHYTENYSTCLSEDVNGNARCGLFLDAVVRGLWVEAVGGTSICSFLNKRMRVDKRVIVPNNRSGYNMWNRANAGLQIGSYLMGNSRFISIEAAIMNIAGMFSTRVYSCSTPTLIPLKKYIGKQYNYALDFVIDEDVRSFLVEKLDKEFGAPYTLNETMLLPPLEFTSPPNCNLFFPPVYNRVQWQYDMDADVTRGYFSVIPSLSSNGGSELAMDSVQVPNALFTIEKAQSNITDSYGRRKPPLTLEERYKGVSVLHGNLEYNIAADDSVSAIVEQVFNPSKVEEIKSKIENLKNKYTKLKNTSNLSEEAQKDVLNDAQRAEIDAELNSKHESILKRKAGNSKLKNSSVYSSLRRHAVIKYLNNKYSGRVVTCDMGFNPYPICGFPGAIIADNDQSGQATKTIIGMVQQIKHSIIITSDGADASTSIVMNNARFDDEPTDMDPYGSPMYMSSTNPSNAEVDPVILQYKNGNYRVPEPSPILRQGLNNSKYDLDLDVKSKGYIYAKDLISLTKKDIDNGEHNSIYLDEEYEPARISRFYKYVLQHRENGFMIDKYTKPDGEVAFFAYDTIHEGLEKLRENRKLLLHDYEEVMKFTSRNICSADAFFQGVLGLSVKNNYSDGQVKFENKNDDFDGSRIDNEYFGVTSDLFLSDNVKGLTGSDGSLKDPGDFSSIRESSPLTAFIQERKEAVKRYINEATKTASSIFYNT